MSNVIIGDLHRMAAAVVVSTGIAQKHIDCRLRPSDKVVAFRMLGQYSVVLRSIYYFRCATPLRITYCPK